MSLGPGVIQGRRHVTWPRGHAGEVTWLPGPGAGAVGEAADSGAIPEAEWMGLYD